MARLEKFHAKTLKGFEPLLAEELSSLGANRTELGTRGVTFYGGRALLYRVNLASRLSSPSRNARSKYFLICFRPCRASASVIGFA